MVEIFPFNYKEARNIINAEYNENLRIVDNKGNVKVKRDAKSRLATLAWLGATVDLMVNLFKGIKHSNYA